MLRANRRPRTRIVAELPRGGKIGAGAPSREPNGGSRAASGAEKGKAAEAGQQHRPG
jgi:hypothetical protein